MKKEERIEKLTRELEETAYYVKIIRDYVIINKITLKEFLKDFGISYTTFNYWSNGVFNVTEKNKEKLKEFFIKNNHKYD